MREDLKNKITTILKRTFIVLFALCTAFITILAVLLIVLDEPQEKKIDYAYEQSIKLDEERKAAHVTPDDGVEMKFEDRRNLYNIPEVFEEKDYYELPKRKTFYVGKNADKYAVDVLYDYFKTNKILGDSDLDKKVFWAFRYDLNSDGVPEILGTYWGYPILGRKSGMFYILQKKNGKYIDLRRYDVITETREFSILTTKTNGYYDIATRVYDIYNNDYYGRKWRFENTTSGEIYGGYLNASADIDNFDVQDSTKNYRPAENKGYIPIKKENVFKDFAINIPQENDSYAIDILSGYLKIQFMKEILQTTTDESEIRFKLNAARDSLWAISFDLDNDGEKEVIGSNIIYCGWYRCPLYILKKTKNGKYQNISAGGTLPEVYKIVIFKSKSNEFHDIAIFDWNQNGKYKQIFKYERNVN